MPTDVTRSISPTDELNDPAVGSSRIVGRCVGVGDDADGQPRLIIHTTREQLMQFGRNLAFADVVVTIAPLVLVIDSYKL